MAKKRTANDELVLRRSNWLLRLAGVVGIMEPPMKKEERSHHVFLFRFDSQVSTW
jgi:hypothetical protein